jgi:hypothetical protein
VRVYQNIAANGIHGCCCRVDLLENGDPTIDDGHLQAKGVTLELQMNYAFVYIFFV